MAGIQLRILGQTELSIGDKPASAALRQPKRMALLAYLALAESSEFRRRDEMIGLFWPEQDRLHARTQLRKALYAIRTTLGADALVTRGEEEVRLDPERVWCDAVEFLRHCDASEWTQAQALYRGDLLQTLAPGGVDGGFQRWLERQRQALRSLAARAGQESSIPADVSGERSVASEITPTSVDLHVPTVPAPAKPRARVRWLVGALAGVSVVLSLAAFAAGTQFTNPPELATVGVLPFNGFADPAAMMVGEGMAEELSTALTQISELSVRSTARSREALRGAEDLREIGRRLAVAHIVDGSVQRSSNRLHVTIRLVRASDGMSLWAQTYDFRPNDLIEAQAEVARSSVGELVPILGLRLP